MRSQSGIFPAFQSRKAHVYCAIFVPISTSVYVTLYLVFLPYHALLGKRSREPSRNWRPEYVRQLRSTCVPFHIPPLRKVQQKKPLGDQRQKKHRSKRVHRRISQWRSRSPHDLHHFSQHKMGSIRHRCISSFVVWDDQNG